MLLINFISDIGFPNVSKQLLDASQLQVGKGLIPLLGDMPSVIVNRYETSCYNVPRESLRSCGIICKHARVIESWNRQTLERPSFKVLLIHSIGSKRTIYEIYQWLQALRLSGDA